MGYFSSVHLEYADAAQVFPCNLTPPLPTRPLTNSVIPISRRSKPDFSTFSNQYSFDFDFESDTEPALPEKKA